jgi:anti-sigma-K factor RskA
MSETDHNRFSENIAAYALGALEPDRVAELERHVEECERCRSELRWLEPAVRTLPESVERREPPRELRRRLMEEVRDDARRAPAPSADGDRAHPERRSRRFGLGSLGWRPLAGLALALVAVAVVAGYEIGNDGSGDGGSTSTIVAGHAPGVTAKMVSEGSGGTLRLANVKPLPDGRVLQAWVERAGEIEPVPALFVPDREGNASTTIDDMEGVETVMVTSEPSGGSKAPTSAPIVTMEVPQ